MKRFTWRELPRNPNVIAGQKISGKNPDWIGRKMTKTELPVIDTTKCIKCAIAWLYCPEGAMKRTPEGYEEIDEEYCVGCGTCAANCPVHAITMVNVIDHLEGKA